MKRNKTIIQDEPKLLEAPTPYGLDQCAKATPIDEFINGRRVGERIARKDSVIMELAKAGVPAAEIREILGLLELW